MSLDRNNVLDIIPLTPLQQGILFQHISSENKTNYFEQLRFNFEFRSGVDKIKDALDDLVNEQPNLRCLYRWKNTPNPLAIYLKHGNLDFTYYDLRNKNRCLGEEFCVQIARKEYEKGFDLEEVPFRVSLCQLTDDTYHIIISNHHILYDGWSNLIILNHLFSHLKEGASFSTPVGNRIPFKGFATELVNKDFDPSKDFWQEHLANFNQYTRLPYEESNLTGTNDFKTVSAFTNREKLEKFCAEKRITIAHLFYGVWGYLLQAYNNAGGSVFGTTLSGRGIDLNRFENVVGLFINTLPLYVEIQPDEKIIDFLSRLSQQIHTRSEHELLPLSEVQKLTNLDSSNELFDSIIVVENYPLDSILTNYQDVIDVRSVESISTNHYKLTIEISFLDEIKIDFVFNHNVFTEESIELISNDFQQVINHFVENFDKPVHTIDITEQGPTAEVYAKINDTSKPITQDITIVDLFENVVNLHPNRVAVNSQGGLTFQALYNKASKVASSLSASGVGANTIVGLYIERSIDFLIGVYGILLSGGAYLPLDPKHPKKRISYILKDSDCQTVLTNRAGANKLEVDNLSVIQLEDCEVAKPLKRTVAKPVDLAYVIYTSGTTGNPKGVMIDHYALLNRLQWMQDKYALESNSVILNKTTPVFDVSVWELFWWSITGSSVSVLADGHEKDPMEIINSIEEHQVTTMHFVPSMLAAFLQVVDATSVDRLQSLETIFCSGEALNREHVEKFNELFGHLATRLVNLYGPTEAAIDVSYYDCSKTDVPNIVPIGKPIDNIKLAVLNQFGNRQPIGLPGELVISGVGLARGYLNKPELTQEKFKQGKQGIFDRYYKTGDLARLTSEGNFEYLGRTDNQVKIRGFRIELHEIESVIKDYEGIDQAIVTYQKDENQIGFLCAYYVSMKEIDLKNLEAFLSQYLPNYMIPAIYECLDMMPLSFNGKVDRSALKITRNTSDKSASLIEKDVNELEAKVVEICAKVLNKEEIDVDQSFFRNGGDSIKAIQVQAGLLKQGYKLNITNIMSANDLREIAVSIHTHVENQDDSKLVGEVASTPTELLFFDSGWSNLDHFSQGVTLKSKRRFEKDAMAQALQVLTEHHDGLRAIYSKSEPGYQKVIEGELQDGILEFEEINSDDPGLVEERITQLRKRINLEDRQLLQVGLYRLNNEDYLILIAHHLLVDGVSWRIIVEDLIDFYHDLIKGVKPKTTRKTTSVKEWSESLQSFAKDPQFLNTVDYWKRLSRERLAHKEAHTSKWKTYQRSVLSLDKGLTQKVLYQTHETYSTNVADLLLYATGLAFIKNFKTPNVAVTLEGHGRENIYNSINLSRTVGWFTSIYPVLLQFENKGDVASDLIKVKETIRKVPFNGLGYGVLKFLTEAHDIEVPTDFLFNYLGDIENDLINNQDYDCRFHSDKNTLDGENQIGHKLLITAIVSDETLNLNFDYDSEKYDMNRMQSFMRKVEVEIKKVVEHCQSIDTSIMTPEDFSDPDMTTEELELISQMFEEV